MAMADRERAPSWCRRIRSTSCLLLPAGKMAAVSCMAGTRWRSVGRYFDPVLAGADGGAWLGLAIPGRFRPRGGRGQQVSWKQAAPRAPGSVAWAPGAGRSNERVVVSRVEPVLLWHSCGWASSSDTVSLCWSCAGRTTTQTTQFQGAGRGPKGGHRTIFLQF